MAAPRLRARSLIAVLLAAATTVGCSPYWVRHEIQSDARAQIYRAGPSQVQVRNAQSRVFDTADRLLMLEAVVATFQDLGFQIELLDEVLGVVSGKKFLDLERPGAGGLPSYLLYDEESLMLFNRSYRTWGPFQRRSDLVRLTVTVRERNASQLIVRASAQFYLRPIEDPAAYQRFYAALEQALFASRASAAR